MRGLSVLFLVVSACFHFMTVPALAQGSTTAADAETVAAEKDAPKTVDKKSSHKEYADTDREVNDGYIVPTFKNLSKLYWALAMFDLSDNAAIDNFLLINECEIYQKYFGSDFEFESLRDATRGSITKNLATYPTKFEIMIPVGLDRYDTGTEKFRLDADSAYIGAKRLEIEVNNFMKPTCGKGSVSIAGYPKNFILSLSRPLHLTEIPVKPEVAQLYIERAQEEAKQKAYMYDYSRFGRVAYIRLKVTINQFKGYVRQTGQPTMADVFGTIDGFEVYADRNKQFLMYSQSTMTKKAPVRRKKESTTGQPSDGSADEAVVEEVVEQPSTQENVETPAAQEPSPQ